MKCSVKELKALMLAVLIGLGLMLQANTAQAGPRESIVVAGGCFWCVESDFEKVPGVISAVSGFSGGKSKNPTYKSHAGHYEAVKITFDAGKVSREKLLHMFMRSIDPTDAGGQFCDRGSAYKTAVFYSGAGEKELARKAVTQAGSDLGRKIATKVLPLNGFYPAGEYHQDYYKSSKVVLTRAGPKSKAAAYKFYRKACGRDQKVKALWGGAAPFAG
ncbi:peptide-methionine (S)-S-oxide reductase MsrA [Lentibacter algarum]|uniref:peptide-methionine (S)-S-oxide reductase MsrA n=1 Tax=Lentibacter algarum TaxID=576131 RepID=UPI001C06E641|nr:peptide-methionine (S)-S-oxide reductase MsrA [Lentibacter algarum]MBU2981097.1 peptide-methionine (S)-S-oxide reductase MsrA [Lentibacter algarum]